MEWTTEKPKDVGYYYVWNDKKGILVLIAPVFRDPSGLFVLMHDMRLTLDDFTHFKGPIPVSSPPVKIGL